MTITEREADDIFAQFLEEKGISPCECGRVIDRADVAWNNAQTESGTPLSFVEVQCLNCQAEIIYWSSWYPDISSFEELVEHVLEDAERSG
jgi:hypothetical protein